MKKRWKRVLALAIVLFVTLQSSACGKEKENVSDHKVDQEQRLEIGLTFDSFVNERWLRDRDMFVSTAKELGAKVNVQVANGEVDKQIEQIEYFIKKKMDVIVIIASDGRKLSDVIEKAHKQGIYVIAYDRMIQNADVDLYISFDNVKVGELMGEYLVRSLPDGGDIFEIDGPESDYNVQLMEKGFHSAIKDSGLNVVYQVNCKNWSADLAYDYVNAALETKRDIVAVMCGNDDLASQAKVALAMNRMSGSILLTGQDADLSACQRIVEGSQSMTIYKSIEKLANTAAKYAVALAEGRKISGSSWGKVKETDLPLLTTTVNDGSYEVPCFVVDPEAVTAENMDSCIIERGFHTKEEVYLNVSR